MSIYTHTSTDVHIHRPGDAPQSKGPHNATEATSQHHHRGQQTLHHEVMQAWVGLYTTLLLPILYGVWHTNGRLEGGLYTVQSACNSIASGWAMQVGAGNERMAASCTKASK